MSFFTSDRERHLWLWALAIILTIYSTLGLARTVVDALRERNLLQVSFAAVVLLLVAAIVVPWLKRRPGWSEIGVAIGIALAYWMTFLRIQNPAERTHLLEYGVVAALIHMALLERVNHGRSVPWPAALTVALTALLGLLDELIQAVLPSRFFDWQDVFFNAFAGFMVIVARLALAPVKRPGWRLWFLWLMAGAIGWGWSLDPGLYGEGRTFEIVHSLPAVEIPPYQGVATGAIVVGILHWLILRRYLPGSFQWVPMNMAAAALGALLVWLMGLLDPDLGFVVGVGLYGTVAGGLQWLVLRRHIARAGWWILASTIGWLVAIPVGDISGPPGWAIYAAVTGAVLVGLLRQENHMAATQ